MEYDNCYSRNPPAECVCVDASAVVQQNLAQGSITIVGGQYSIAENMRCGDGDPEPIILDNITQIKSSISLKNCENDPTWAALYLFEKDPSWSDASGQPGIDNWWNRCFEADLLETGVWTRRAYSQWAGGWDGAGWNGDDDQDPQYTTEYISRNPPFNITFISTPSGDSFEWQTVVCENKTENSNYWYDISANVCYDISNNASSQITPIANTIANTGWCAGDATSPPQPPPPKYAWLTKPTPCHGKPSGGWQDWNNAYCNCESIPCSENTTQIVLVLDNWGAAMKDDNDCTVNATNIEIYKKN